MTNPSPSPSLTVVTASIDPERTREYWETWLPLATLPSTSVVMVVNREGEKDRVDNANPKFIKLYAPQVLGTVGAFYVGIGTVEWSAPNPAPILACLHDDVLIKEAGWDTRVLTHFGAHPTCGLAGFGGEVDPHGVCEVDARVHAAVSAFGRALRVEAEDDLFEVLDFLACEPDMLHGMPSCRLWIVCTGLSVSYNVGRGKILWLGAHYRTLVA